MIQRLLDTLRARLPARIRQDANLKDLLRNSGILYAAGMISLALTFVQQVSTANWLGSEDYGRLAIVLSSGLLVMLVIDFRTWEIGTKLLTNNTDDASSEETVRVTSWLAGIEIVSGVLSVLVMILLSSLIAEHLLKVPHLQDLIAIYALAIPFRILSSGVLSVFPRIYGRFDWLAWKSIAYSLIRLFLMSGAAMLGTGLPGVVLGAIIGEIFNFGLLTVIALRLYRPRVPRLYDFTRPAQFGEGRRMMGEVWISSSLAGLHYQTFIPVMALLTTPAQVGLFRSGLDVVELLERIIQPLSIVFTPKIIALYHSGDHPSFLRYLKQCAALLTSMVLPIVIGVMIFGPILLPLILQSEGFQDVAIITNILMMGTGIHTVLQWWLRPAAIATRTVYEQNNAQLTLIILSLAIMALTVPAYGALAGAWVKAGFLTLFSVMSLLLFLRHRNKRHPAIESEMSLVK